MSVVQQARKPFQIDNYLESLQIATPVSKNPNSSVNNMTKFNELCAEVHSYFKEEWLKNEGSKNDDTKQLLQNQKNAIIGHTKEVNYFKGKINEYLKKNGSSNEWYPSWFEDLTSAIFHQNWGLAGIMEWKNMKDSSSAKIIGERIYFMVGGKQVLQNQTISRDRLNQLITALMLRTPEKRLDEGYAEVYMLDGTRITIFVDGTDGLAKEAIIIFRKYIVDRFSFEEQAERGTIPADIIPLLEAMVRIGFNVNFLGPVRSGKTTFLQTYQSYEDESLEGIQIETDPEIPLHILMPKAPIGQIVADGDKLRNIIKRLMRADGDYLIMAESRDGVALKILIEATAKGTRRVKGTYHTSDPIDFPYDAANSIVQEFGGDVWAYTIKVAKSFHYLFEFVQLKDKSKKRLKGIYELRYDPKSLAITIHQICKYDFRRDEWSYKYDIGEDKVAVAEQEDFNAFEIFRNELKKLADKNEIEGDHVIELPYFKYQAR